MISGKSAVIDDAEGTSDIYLENANLAVRSSFSARFPSALLTYVFSNLIRSVPSKL